MPGLSRTHFANRMRSASWLGGSGRAYDAVPESLEAFRFDDSSIYILVNRNAPGWVGSARDLIEDQVSRARFKLAMQSASNVLRLQGPSDDVERMVLKFDLESGHQVACRDAA